MVERTSSPGTTMMDAAKAARDKLLEQVGGMGPGLEGARPLRRARLAT
jgi:hypothetical protein